MTESRYPLYWPEGRARAASYSRETARFETSFARARDEIIHQITLMVGKYRSQLEKANIILSTNVPLRQDGLPLAGKKAPEDPGVAVYFVYKERRVCFACDRWKTVEDNMQAIAKTIDALRGIARWGTGDMLEAAFKGFEALPSQAKAKTWREVFGFREGEYTSFEQVTVRYRQLAQSAHSDKGGSDARMAELNVARDAARKAFGQ